MTFKGSLRSTQVARSDLIMIISPYNHICATQLSIYFKFYQLWDTIRICKTLTYSIIFLYFFNSAVRHPCSEGYVDTFVSCCIWVILFETWLHFDNLLGDVGELGPPSEDVVEAFDSAGSVGGGTREGAGPGGANICDEM